MEEHGNPIQGAPMRARIAQNSPNHKNGNLVKNHLLQPHLDNQRKLRILSQNRLIEIFIKMNVKNNFMKAVIKAEPKAGLEFRDVQEPKITSSSQVLIEVRATAICGSDVHILEWHSGYEFMPLPIIIGHEFSGEIVDLGLNVKGLKKGDRVVCNPIVYCGGCSYCKAGKTNLCQQFKLVGLDYNGSFAKYVLIPQNVDLYKLPDTVSYEHAAIFEPFSVAFHAIEESRIQPGDLAAVLGAGPIALMLTQLLKLNGVSVVVTGLSIDEERLKVAKDLGADFTINVEEKNPIEKVRDITGDQGVDVIFEASGDSNCFSQALKMIKRGGEIIGIGIYPSPSPINFTDVVRREIKIKGVRTYLDSSWRHVITMATRKMLNIDALITHKFPLNEFLKGFELLKQRKAIKVLLTP